MLRARELAQVRYLQRAEQAALVLVRQRQRELEARARLRGGQFERLRRDAHATRVHRREHLCSQFLRLHNTTYSYVSSCPFVLISSSMQVSKEISSKCILGRSKWLN